MALWLKVKELNTLAIKEILQVYSINNIPIELRDLCSEWIEASAQQSSAEKFCTGLREQLGNRLTVSNSLPFYVTGKLMDFLNNLNTSNAAVFQNIYRRFQACLDFEKYMVKKSERTSETVSPSTYTSINQQPNSNANFVTPTHFQECSEVHEPEKFLQHPLKLTIDAAMNNALQDVGILEEASNTFSIKFHEIKQLQASIELNNSLISTGSISGTTYQFLPPCPQLPDMQTKMMEVKSEVMQLAPQICQKILAVRADSIRLLQNWMQLKGELDKDLLSWSIQQKLNSNGKPLAINLRRLQQVAEYLMEVAWKLRSLLMAADSVCKAHPSLMIPFSKDSTFANGTPGITEQIFTVTNLVKKLVQDTFLIEHQPCQVLKTNTRFHILPGRNPMEVCSLVGEKLGMQLSQNSVSVCIVDEATCMEIFQHGLEGERFNTVGEGQKGKLLPESLRLDFCQEKKCVSAVFRQISLKEFYRTARNRTASGGKDQAELVTEEKFALLFRSKFSVGDIEFQVWSLSLPIVITTHGSQESLAWAAVSWDNAFSQINRIPFQLPDYVSWEGVSDMLNSRFMAMVGAPLTHENISYFAERLSIFSGFPEKLTWSELCKNLLPGRKFTFWDWYYEGAKLIEQHLKDAWKDGYVKGFIGKESSENMLCGSLPGTFLLRFSESTLGGISVVWLHSNGTAYSLAPFKSKDLSTQPFVEKIDQETLHYVYPRTLKEEAFRKYYEDNKQRSDGSNGNFSDRYIQVMNRLVIVDPRVPPENRQGSLIEAQNSLEPMITSGPDDMGIEIDFDELLKACEMEPMPNYSYTEHHESLGSSTFTDANQQTYYRL